MATGGLGRDQMRWKRPARGQHPMPMPAILQYSASIFGALPGRFALERSARSRGFGFWLAVGWSLGCGDDRDPGGRKKSRGRSIGSSGPGLGFYRLRWTRPWQRSFWRQLWGLRPWLPGRPGLQAWRPVLRLLRSPLPVRRRAWDLPSGRRRCGSPFR